nr:glycosyltransferase family 2 protein [Turicibacter bilis]
MPVYNAEQYLKSTIQSIRNQTFTNWELIIINDGSNDKSGLLCDEFSKIDTRIKVIHQHNQGVAITRNKLLEYVENPYFCFVDADDEIDSKIYEILLGHMLEKNPDVVMCGIIEKNYLGDRVYSTVERTYESKLLCIEHMRNSFMDFFNTLLLNSTCNKIYKKKIVDDYNLRFCDLETGEDLLFNLDYLLHSQNIYVEEKCLYLYLRRNMGSITRSYVEDLYEKGLIVHKALLNFLEKKELASEANYQIIEYNHLLSVFSTFLNLTHKQCKLNISDRKKIIKSIIIDDYVKECANKQRKQKGLVGLTAQLIKIGSTTTILTLFKILAITRDLKTSIKQSI